MSIASTDSIQFADSPPGTAAGDSVAEPGMVMVFAADRPYCALVPLTTTPLELGRGQGILGEHADSSMSRRHARICYRDSRFLIEDLGSRNGSALDGKPLIGSVTTEAQRVLRLGHSLFLLCHDISPYRLHRVKVHNGRVEGPTLQRALRSVARLAEHSRTLFIIGETGAGKESMAQAFHGAGPQQRGPFVAVNCATIPEGLAERLLFGAQKGAYSGAASDSEGYLQAAHGGTLFLDEVADLDVTVQAKLLRALETQEVTPLGSTRARQIDIRVCSATHKNLRAQATAGTFRADLYFRLGMPQVAVPPLRHRREEIPWHVVHVAAKVAPELKASAQFVEACLLRDWPGNVRELLAELNTAVVNALSAGAPQLNVNHLSVDAGAALVVSPQPEAQGPGLLTTTPAAADPAPNKALESKRAPPSRTQLMMVLHDSRGNLSAAARALGLHRTQLRRYLSEHGIDLARVRQMHKP